MVNTEGPVNKNGDCRYKYKQRNRKVHLGKTFQKAAFKHPGGRCGIRYKILCHNPKILIAGTNLNNFLLAFLIVALIGVFLHIFQPFHLLLTTGQVLTPQFNILHMRIPERAALYIDKNAAQHR